MPNVGSVVSKQAARAAPRPGPRPGFTRDEIVGCALRLMDREGHAALSFRAVARELDMTVGALSRYFPNLADLQDEVAAKVMSTIRPLQAGSKVELREQLARHGMDLMEVTRAHPYLAEIHGPASATVITRSMTQSLRVLMNAGIPFERALVICSVVANLAQSWGMRDARIRTPEQKAGIAAAAAAEMGDLFLEMNKLPQKSASATYRGWFLLVIDGLLP